MYAERFAEVYPREIRDTYQDAHADVLQSAREWSGYFGTQLHDYMSTGPLPTQELTSGMREYFGWHRDNMRSIFEKIIERTDDEDEHSRNAYWRAAQELNFHSLNISMLPMWAQLAENPEAIKTINQTYPGVGRAAITLSQIETAAKSLLFQDERATMISAADNYPYFHKENAHIRHRLEGILNEMDGAIVLLELCRKHPELVVVPGPHQFEDSVKALNSDFIMIDTVNHQVRGIQLKGNVISEHIDIYDKERVLLIDASLDMGNVLTLRTQKGRSDKKTVNWAGLISASYINQLPTSGRPARNLISFFDIRFLMQQKLKAREHLRGSKPHLAQAVRKIGERVLSHLSEDTQLTVQE